MKKKQKKLINYFKKKGGISRFSNVLREGFHSDSLYSLLKDKKVEKISRGLYRLANDKADTHPDLVLASFEAPKGVVCLVSALYFHEATNEIPRHIDVAIPRGTHANKIKYPPVRFYRFNLKSWESGIEEHKIQGRKIKVYSLAKTIADCFKFRNKIGMNIARDALKIAVIEKHIKPKEIMKYSIICRVDNIIKPILETLI